MADESRPLSRRERREMEERAAGVEPVTAPPTAREPAPTLPPQGDEQDAALSRRDRRRLERLEQPMETWTAVEEMHHTGQVPTMTPEVIAQQEELARRRAAEAQADAVRATGEIHQVGAHQITPEAMERVTGEEPAVAPLEKPGEEPAIALPENPGEEPAISRFDMPDEAPRAPADEARRKLAQAAAAAAAALPADRERAPAPAPGHARQEHGILDAPRPPTSEVPTLVNLTPPSGIPGALLSGAHAATGPQAQVPRPSSGEVPPAHPQQGDPGQGAPLPPSGAVPDQGAPFPLSGAIPGVVPPASAASPTPSPTVGVAGVPHEADVGQVLPGAQQGAPAAQQGAPGAPQGAPGAQQAPAFGLATGPVPAQTAPSPFPPGTALGQVATGTLHPVLGQTGTMRAIPGPMTGTIPRPIVEVQPAGGAKDFGWQHIAVLAAVAFALGIVVWQISGLGG